MGLAARDVKTLKGQCHEIFNPFFGIKQLCNGLRTVSRLRLRAYDNDYEDTGGRL